ncbi:MAG: hypothetical protein JOZ01_07195, partial [Candidatus Eremiobacteraeota bacterium]|nr:hypothetical protein [Candidatus Eremiobacteraeota bacterium]
MGWLFILGAIVLPLGCSPAGRAMVAPADAVRFALAADPQSLNPLLLRPDAASIEQQVDRLAFEPFIELDTRGNPVPALLAVVPTRE